MSEAGEQGVSAAQVARIGRTQALYATNPMPGLTVTMVVIGMLFAALWVLVVLDSALLSLSILVGLAGVISAMYRRMLRVFGARRVDGQIQCDLDAPGRLPMRYRFAYYDEGQCTLHIDWPLPEGIRIAAGAKGICDPRFDAAFGMWGEPHEVALLGPTLRALPLMGLGAYAPVIDSTGLHLDLARRPLPPAHALTRLAFALDAFGRRLADPPTALARLAADLQHPFDAARALAALGERWPADAKQVAKALGETPEGTALARVALTGHGLGDPALSAAAREAIGRGVLGIPGAACDRLHADIASLGAQTPAEAMAVIGLVEAARLDDVRLDHLLDLIESEGGPECLAWLQTRARRGRPDRKRLDRFNARLAGAFAGHLSVEATEAVGALSDSRGGELALDDPVGEDAAPTAVTQLGSAGGKALDRARRKRGTLRQLDSIAVAIALSFALLVAMFFVSAPAWLWPVGTGLIFAKFYARPSARRSFRLRLRDRQDLVLTAPDAPLSITYRRRASTRKNEWLLFRPATPMNIELEPAREPLLDPGFDAALGLTASERRRALLGPQIRLHAASWRSRCGFQIVRGRAEVRIGQYGVDVDDPIVRRVGEAVHAYAERLAAPPIEALSAMARDLDHPFDAARALAALARDWRGPPERLAEEIADRPLGAFIGRMALTGEGLADTSVPWAQRIEIARGVLGVSGAARDRLVRDILAIEPSDDATAMAAVELAEAAQSMVCLGSLEARRGAALTYIGQTGGADCLPWLTTRAARDDEAAVLAERVRARLLNAAR